MYACILVLEWKWPQAGTKLAHFPLGQSTPPPTQTVKTHIEKQASLQRHTVHRNHAVGAGSLGQRKAERDQRGRGSTRGWTGTGIGSCAGGQGLDEHGDGGGARQGLFLVWLVWCALPGQFCPLKRPVSQAHPTRETCRPLRPGHKASCTDPSTHTCYDTPQYRIIQVVGFLFFFLSFCSLNQEC